MTRKKGPEQIQLPCNLPLSIISTEDELNIALAQSGSVSYILGALPGKKATDMGTPKVFKVVKNIVGYATVPLNDDDDLDLAYVDQHAWFGLPPIPRKIVDDLDAFFRLVDDKFGTESIALLVYDPLFLDKEESAEGWGTLIPKQSNTAGSCKYDPASVAEKKEEGVMIVGSVHSHPGMAAFASHTDIGDQANFDGIHITYGWKKNSKVTEYHIELQMGGGRFTFTPEQAFEQVPEPPVPDEVVEWVENVEKYVPANNTYQMGTSGAYGYANRNKKMTLPEGVGHPDRAGVVIDVLIGESKCPACANYLVNDERERRRCSDCMCFLAINGESVEDVIIQRGKGGFEYMAIDKLKQDNGIWHWQREKEGNTYKTKEVVVVKAPLPGK